MSTLPEPTQSARPLPAHVPDFDALIAVLPPSQCEVVSMLKVSGMSPEEVSRSHRIQRGLGEAPRRTAPMRN